MRTKIGDIGFFEKQGHVIFGKIRKRIRLTNGKSINYMTTPIGDITFLVDKDHYNGKLDLAGESYFDIQPIFNKDHPVIMKRLQSQFSEKELKLLENAFMYRENVDSFVLNALAPILTEQFLSRVSLKELYKKEMENQGEME